MSFETLLPCPFCGGEPEEDAGGCSEFYGHEHQDYSITCKSCGAEVYCSVGTFEKADVPCSCHHDTRKVCVDKWNKRATMIKEENAIKYWHGLYNEIKGLGRRHEGDFAPDLSMSTEEIIDEINGWTENHKANAALIMLDRIDTADPADDDRIEDIKRIVRELANNQKEVR